MSNVTTNTSNGLEHPIGLMGWGVANETIQEKHSIDRKMIGALQAARPMQMMLKPANVAITGVQSLDDSPNPLLVQFNAFQKKYGRHEGSMDLSLLDFFVFKKRLRWFPQPIGSCVWSNTWRVIVDRMLAELMLKGDPEELFGMDEYGAMSLAPHAIQYGLARQRANMRGGDGLYCGPMADSLGGDGMLMCNVPKLQEVMKAAGANLKYDLPEPRGTSLYRQIGDWKFNAVLKPFCDHRVTETPVVTNIDDHLELSKAMKPIFQCSGIAIKAAGKHKDGFTIHQRDPNNSWAHNMAFKGHFYSSDNKLFLRFSNLSWTQNNDPDAEHADEPRWDDEHEKYLYNLPAEHVKGWYDKNLVDSAAIGEIDMPDSAPPSL
jgi:hypothetical protein